ncbi:hypothetical protein HD554DRAFT_2023788 [Boletus coccyginus]|nr:hypothetical protein HD554DRAFT_2023788 [Boletus coccyginus]
MKPPPDSVPHAHYTSQIEPIFTELHAKEQARQEQQRQVDAIQREAIRQAKNCVVVYAWCKDNPEPASCEFQEGFMLPHFRITAGVVTELELPPFDSAPSQIMYFNTVEKCWVKALWDHQITLAPNEHRVFLKDHAVTNCTRFDELCIVMKPANLFSNLPGE